MEEKSSEQQKPKCLSKLPTGIRGLDKVLYGGIDANVFNPLYIKEQVIERTPLVIVIRGNEDDNDKCMLAMQMLYGIAQSIENIKSQYQVFGERWNNEPIMYSTYYQAHKLDDLFLDFFISSSLQEILRKKASKDTSVNLSSNIFTDILFDSSQILCQGISRNANIPYSAIATKTDAMMGDGIIYYNRRTNSLHVLWGDCRVCTFETLRLPLDKISCTRQFESKLSLRSFAKSLAKRSFFENLPVLPYP